jgi:hypothetical protein
MNKMSVYEIDKKLMKQARNHVWHQIESLRNKIKQYHSFDGGESLFYQNDGFVFCDLCKKEIQKNQEFDIHHGGKHSFKRLFEMFCEIKGLWGEPLIELKRDFDIVKNNFQEGSRPFLNYSNKHEKTILDWQQWHLRFSRLKPVHRDCHVKHHK